VNIFKLISKRDFLLVFGLCLLGYGLYLFAPWVSFAVCGAIVLAGGFFMSE
jgi:hypothetical protein